MKLSKLKKIHPLLFPPSTFVPPNFNDCIVIKNPPPQYFLFLRIILYWPIAITRKKTLGLEIKNTPYL